MRTQIDVAAHPVLGDWKPESFPGSGGEKFTLRSGNLTIYLGTRDEARKHREEILEALSVLGPLSEEHWG